MLLTYTHTLRPVTAQVLFENMTCLEHLELFAVLKVSRWSNSRIILAARSFVTRAGANNHAHNRVPVDILSCHCIYI